LEIGSFLDGAILLLTCYNDICRFPHILQQIKKERVMKTPRLSVVIVLLTLSVLLAFGGATSVNAQDPVTGNPNGGVVPQSTAGGGGPGQMVPYFTYQGQLKQNGGAYTGTCDFAVDLWNQSTGGLVLGGWDYELAVPINNGLFTMTVNASEQFNPSGNSAFQGDLRWLEIWVKCPAGVGTYVKLLPRQLITTVPYALTLVPGSQGSRVNGSAYQLLKVVNSTTVTGNAAAVTGEIASTDGVGLYGGNTNTAVGTTGIGVWGRTYSRGGAGVLGTGYNGSVGVHAVSSGTGINSPALFAEDTNIGTTTPAGIAIYALNHSADATLVLHNAGAGDLIRGFNQAGNAIVYSVSGTGHVTSTLVTTTGGSDLAEQFAVSAAAPEPGTLMVIDPDHPGQLKISSTAYDTLVAGVVSGAGGLQAGMTLAQQDGVPIAIAGRVYVKAEANSAPIKPGDRKSVV
jgi:hypothetical protein